MKTNIIKNVLFNIAALGLGFSALTYLPISTLQVFSLFAMAGIGLIAVKDYTPRRQLSFTPSAPKAVVVKITRRRVSALVAA